MQFFFPQSVHQPLSAFFPMNPMYLRTKIIIYVRCILYELLLLYIYVSEILLCIRLSCSCLILTTFRALLFVLYTNCPVFVNAVLQSPFSTMGKKLNYSTLCYPNTLDPSISLFSLSCHYRLGRWHIITYVFIAKSFGLDTFNECNIIQFFKKTQILFVSTLFKHFNINGDLFGILIWTLGGTYDPVTHRFNTANLSLYNNSPCNSFIRCTPMSMTRLERTSSEVIEFCDGQKRDEVSDNVVCDVGFTDLVA
ncbi:hypothetical protein AGLY_006677 [Aphis glycines]|uniref:Uncharacterized protein n=1 Tax=Aphis glycines TaxID=307491 RepID=A0A6G0TRU6_APHGL|nr:hypothetical protein AGLY_006677 [Aphis glycines]